MCFFTSNNILTINSDLFTKLLSTLLLCTIRHKVNPVKAISAKTALCFVYVTANHTALQ